LNNLKKFIFNIFCRVARLGVSLDVLGKRKGSEWVQGVWDFVFFVVVPWGQQGC
jgi:hypothetical protein